MAELPAAFRQSLGGAAFNASTEEKLGDFSAIPAGKYMAMITKSEFKQTKAGDGTYLSLHFKVMGGEHNGRMVFTNLNLVNPNATAVEIARKSLASICEAMGITEAWSDTNVLHDKPLMIRVKVNPETTQYAESNDVNGYESAQGVTLENVPASAAGSSAMPTPAAAQMGGNKLPWQ